MKFAHCYENLKRIICQEQERGLLIIFALINWKNVMLRIFGIITKHYFKTVDYKVNVA